MADRGTQFSTPPASWKPTGVRRKRRLERMRRSEQWKQAVHKEVDSQVDERHSLSSAAEHQSLDASSSAATPLSMGYASYPFTPPPSRKTTGLSLSATDIYTPHTAPSIVGTTPSSMLPPALNWAPSTPQAPMWAGGYQLPTPPSTISSCYAGLVHSLPLRPQPGGTNRLLGQGRLDTWHEPASPSPTTRKRSRPQPDHHLPITSRATWPLPTGKRRRLSCDGECMTDVNSVDGTNDGDDDVFDASSDSSSWDLTPSCIPRPFSVWRDGTDFNYGPAANREAFLSFSSDSSVDVHRPAGGEERRGYESTPGVFGTRSETTIGWSPAYEGDGGGGCGNCSSGTSSYLDDRHVLDAQMPGGFSSGSAWIRRNGFSNG